ncbi:MAG: hypothetical protein OHK0021_10450 [Bryobacter sp.]
MRSAIPAFSLAVCLLGVVSCVSDKEKSPTLPEASIAQLSPDKVMEATPFNQQPGGGSALSVMGKNLVKGSRIKLNGMALETASGDGSSLAAIVPPELFAKEGNYIVTVETPDGRGTNALAWRVLPKSGPAPEIKELFPGTTQAGKGFNVQPNGAAALGMTGSNFLPGAQIVFGDKPLETNFGDTDKLGATVPPELFRKAGKVKVTVKNPDGKVSAAADFTITP